MLGVDTNKLNEMLERLERVAESQAESALRIEEAAERFGEHVNNMSAELSKDRRSRREYT